MDSPFVLLGGAVALSNGLILLILAHIRSDQKEEHKRRQSADTEMWHRIYSHYHEIACANKDCTALKTGNVIVPFERS